MNDRSRLHLTVFYLSHVEDLRPEPYRLDGGKKNGALTAQTLKQEEQTLRHAVASFPAFDVQVMLHSLATIHLPGDTQSGRLVTVTKQL